MPDSVATSQLWCEGVRISSAGQRCIDGTVSCVFTRFRLRSIFWLPFFFLAFRRVYREARAAVPGLIKAVFLVENGRTCYTLSLWTDDSAIIEFGKVFTHVAVANWAFGPVFRKDLKRPEIWSTHWRLWAVSENLNWEGLDLRQVLARQMEKPS